MRARIPAASRQAKNSCSLFEDAAAVMTCRRSVILGVSSRPRRAAFSFSARVGRRAAVRSAGAVERSPYRCSAARQDGADLVPFPGQAGLAAVLAGQHRNQVDVIIAVPDGDPADGLVFLAVG
jgi:hypothetical protein